MSGLLDRFSGPENRDLLMRTLRRQRLIAGDESLAHAFADRGSLALYSKDDILIEQGAWDSDIYFILAGSFAVIINGQFVASRGAGVHVGELTGLNGARARTATLRAESESLVLKIAQKDVELIAGENPQFWRAMADVVADRLDQRNAGIGMANVHPRVLIISSTEAMLVARHVRGELNSENLHVRLWDKGVFTLSGYPISDLEDSIEAADFTISIVRPDDAIVIREKAQTTARDNVHLEFGISVGKLGRVRSVLLVDAEPGLHLPSDTAGLTTLRYSHQNKDEMERTVGVACDRFREHVETYGVRQDRRVQTS